METDSFIIHIKTEDVYEDIQMIMKKDLIYQIMQLKYEMNMLRFALNLSTNNNIARKYTKISATKERIKQLAKSWYEKSVINNLDIKEFIRTAVAYPNTPLAYRNN